MRLIMLLGLLASPGFAESMDQFRTRLAIEDASKAQVTAINAQTDAIHSAAIDAWFANRCRSSPKCKPVRLSEEGSNGESMYLTTPSGEKIGPLYVMECR